MGSVSLMQTQPGNVRWFGERAVKVQERQDPWFSYKAAHLTSAQFLREGCHIHSLT